MADDISLAELGRRIDAMAHDVREDISGLNARLEQYVLQRVYAAEQTTLQLRISQLELRVKEGEDQRRVERDKAEEQRRATSRWIVAAIAVPVLTTITGILFQVVAP